VPTIRTTNFRKAVAGLCLLSAPLLFAGSEMLAPDSDSSGAAEQLTAFAQHRGLLLASALLGIATSILFIPALFGLLQYVRARGASYGHVAVTLMLYGLITAHAALDGINIMFWEMAKPGMDRTAMVSLLDGLQHESVGAPLLAGHYLFAIGYILLGVALWRARSFPRWAALFVILTPIIDALASFTPVNLIGEGIANTLAVAAFGAMGLKMLTAPVASWDGAPAEVTAGAAQPVPQQV
jgi:hypothetical protein